MPDLEPVVIFPQLFVAEFDISQFGWLIVLMVIGFLNWVANKLKGNREEEDQQEVARQVYEHELAQQQQQQQPPSLPQHQQQQERSTPPPPPAQTRTASSEVRSFFESLVTPVAPPPPPPQRSLPPKPPKQKPANQLTREEELALKAIKEKGESNLTRGRTRRNRMQASDQHTALANMLRDPVSMRNAFILKEVLDPPAALKELE